MATTGTPMSQMMKHHLAIAVRDGGAIVAGASEHKGRVEYHFAATLMALASRGLVKLNIGPDGTTMARLTAAGWVAAGALGVA